MQDFWDVTLCHWMWQCATGCDTVPLDEQILLFQGTALPLTARSSGPKLTFWTTWPWRWQHYATGHCVTADCYLTTVWYGSLHRRVKEFSINLYIIIFNQLMYPLSSATLLHKTLFFTSSVTVTIWQCVFQSVVRLVDQLTSNSPSPRLSKLCAHCPAVELPCKHICMFRWVLVLVQTSDHCTQDMNPWHSWVSSKHSAISHALVRTAWTTIQPTTWATNIPTNQTQFCRDTDMFCTS